MPQKILDNIFSSTEPTTRVGTQGERGTGLGMPIVFKILQLYKADIKVTSKSQDDYPDDHGTQFEITFKSSS